MKKVLVVLLVLLVLLGAAAVGGYLYADYRSSHIFVEDAVYPIDAASLDLRGQDISFDHYNEVHNLLPNCQVLWDVPFQGGKVASNTQSLTVSTLTREDAQVLAAYLPELTSLDATGCEDYPLLTGLQGQLPKCRIVYQVRLGAKTYPLDTAQLTLEPQDYDLDILTENLRYLPGVTAVTLRTPAFGLEAVDALRQAYPDVTFACTVELLGQEYDTETAELDLSAMTAQDVAEVAGKLAMLPNLGAVELMDSAGSSALTLEDVKTLTQAAPEAAFHYTFDFYGLTLSTDDTQVVLTNKSIGDDGEAEVRNVLDLLTNCERFVLDNCKLSNDVLAQMREDYRDRMKIVWRVYFGKGSCLTDVDVIRCTYDLVDNNCHDLVYCEDVRFIDFGHNEFLDACEFVSGMPNLEYIILSGAPIKDLTPFENCKQLKFLEIAFCEYVTDLTPLAGCESLQMLNISNTHAVDLAPLDELDLTFLCAKMYPGGVSRVSGEEQSRFRAQHPDCWTTFNEDAQPYGVGWRYDEDKITPLPQYALIQRAFGYPNAINNAGWYFDETQTE